MFDVRLMERELGWVEGAITCQREMSSQSRRWGRSRELKPIAIVNTYNTYNLITVKQSASLRTYIPSGAPKPNLASSPPDSETDNYFPGSCESGLYGRIGSLARLHEQSAEVDAQILNDEADLNSEPGWESRGKLSVKRSSCGSMLTPLRAGKSCYHGSTACCSST